MSEDAHPGRLEARYRLLLAVFPSRHRSRHGEAMVDVLMASSTPEQRWPGLRESLDLVVCGLRVRLGSGLGRSLSPASRSAAIVFGFLASVVFAAVSWYQVAAALAWHDVWGGPEPHGWFAQVPHRSLAMGLAWTLAAAAGVAGMRQLAAVGAVVGFLGEAVIVGRDYGVAPSTLVSSWWLLTLSAFAAVCLAGASGVGARAAGWRDVLRRDPERPRPLGRRAVVACAAGLALAVVEPVVDRALTDVQALSGGGGWMMSSRIPSLAIPGGYGADRLGVLVLAGVLVVLVLRMRPAVRRRVLVLAAPTAAAGLLVETEFRAVTGSSVHLTVGQWVALTLAPLLVFATGAWLLRRYERLLAAGAPLI